MRHDTMGVSDIAIEHGALTRQLASLQRHVSEQMQANARHVRALEGEVVRLRAQWIVMRTGQFWGLGTAGAVRPLARHAPPTAPAAEMAEASSVICQTACVGHAHPWLEADGQCRRTGLACEHVTAPTRSTTA